MKKLDYEPLQTLIDLVTPRNVEDDNDEKKFLVSTKMQNWLPDPNDEVRCLRPKQRGGFYHLHRELNQSNVKEQDILSVISATWVLARKNCPRCINEEDCPFNKK